MKVFHAPISFAADASDNPNKGVGILAGCAADGLFTEGSWNADFHPSMQPQQGEHPALRSLPLLSNALLPPPPSNPTPSMTPTP